MGMLKKMIGKLQRSRNKRALVSKEEKPRKEFEEIVQEILIEEFEDGFTKVSWDTLKQRVFSVCFFLVRMYNIRSGHRLLTQEDCLKELEEIYMIEKVQARLKRDRDYFLFFAWQGHYSNECEVRIDSIDEPSANHLREQLMIYHFDQIISEYEFEDEE
jgi:hypothetical protein